jgi:predicted RNA binding protein YcfA (HicA-like mRNA interferase family)
MTPLCNIEGRLLIRFIESLNYKFVRQRGSHIRYKNRDGNAITLHVKGKKIIKPGRLRGLFRDLNIEPKVFFDYIGLKL